MHFGSLKTALALLLFALLVGCRVQRNAAGASGEAPETTELAWEDLPAAPAAGVSPGGPMNLTASDGTGIELVTLHARGAVEGPLAFTELSLVFENPSPRVLEGTFTVTLPPTASVHRFAMRIGGLLQEGEIVERQKAEQTFEAFLHQNVDPALLEQQPGNQFRARVFPIAPNEQKEIVLSYSEILEDSEQPYRLYLSGLPTLDELDIRVSVANLEGGHSLYHLERELFTPDRDFVLPEAARAGAPALVRAGNLAAVRLNTRRAAKADPIDDITVLVDTSASRAGDLKSQVKSLRQLLSALAGRGNPRARVVVFDQDAHDIWSGRASEFGEPQVSQIVTRGAGGATDLGRALAKLEGKRTERLLLLSDAVFTAGASALPDLERRTRAAGIKRLDIALAGATRDEQAAKRLAGSGLRAGTLLDHALGMPKALDGLLGQRSSPLTIRVPGSRFSFPERVSAAEAGDETVVFAELTGDGPLEVVLNEKRHTFSASAAASQALVEKALVRARIEKLMKDYDSAKDDAIRGRIHRRVVSLSRKHRVLSPFTSLLVLESEADYARFGIDRSAPYEFMAVGESGTVEIFDRTRDALPPDGLSGLPVRRGVPITDDAVDDEGEMVPNQAVWGQRRPSGALPRGAAAANRDSDGIIDTMDRCPMDREDRDGFEDQDGCPEPDNDRDRILDAQDRCPNDPETYNGFEDRDGCPDRGKVIVESSEITILEAIRFETATAVIQPESRAIIDQIVATLRSHPAIRRLEIAGHTDNQGSRAHNQELSERRARAVYEALVRGGIAQGRLIARGYGDRCPIDNNATAAGRERNRRVEFKILETEDGPTGSRTCTAAPSFKGREVTPSALQPAAVERPSRPSDPLMLAPSALEGEPANIRSLLDKRRADQALRAALAYRDRKPQDELAWVALGDCYLQQGAWPAAARAYGSLIDLAGDAAPKRRAAGALLESVHVRARQKDPKLASNVLALAVDAYAKALERRPDHPSSYKLYAYALAKQGRLEQAFDVLVRASDQNFAQRFFGAKAQLAADLGLIAATIAARKPEVREELQRQLQTLRVAWPTGPSLRFVLSWESDTSDVNLVVHAGDRRLSSQRSANNVRDGFGPEEIALSEFENIPHRIGVTYDRRGFQGYALGKVTVVHHDGAGGLFFDDRPFALMKEHGYADLGEFRVPAR